MVRNRANSSFTISAFCAFLAACADGPVEVLDHAFRALERGDLKALGTHVGDDYVDTLGGRAALLRDLEDLTRTFGWLAVTPGDISVSGTTKRDATIVGRLEIEAVGEPTWRVLGPLEVRLVDDGGGFRIASGFLHDLRDVRALAAERRAALEGNDGERYAKLLHPTYRDGDVDAADARARLIRDLQGVRVRIEPTLYKLEVRGPIAHLDEHYVLTVRETRQPAAVGRFTLRRAAGLWKIAAGLYPDR